MTRSGIGSHQSARNLTNNWITPEYVIKTLGPFDLDPACCKNPPWKTARRMWSKGGLDKPWKGFVWCNPPYGREVGDWVERAAKHDHGFLLLFARTDTKWFHKWIFPCASSLFFPKGRIRFCRPDGTPGKYTGGAPSVIVAYGGNADYRLKDMGIDGARYLTGKYVKL